VAARPATIAVAVPTLNEEASIGAVVESIRRALACRVIVADGGSTDATAERARAAGAEVIDAGRGYGRACWKAVEAADGADIIAFMDGDGADDPGEHPGSDQANRGWRAGFRHRLARARRT